MMRDLRFIRAALVTWRPLLRIAFRLRVSGFERVPDREPLLLVANHSIGAGLEIMALLAAWEDAFPSRPIYGLTHRFGFLIPGLRQYLNRIGGVPATYESAYRVLKSGSSLLVFPGGNWEAARPWTERHQTDFGGRMGWAKIAIQSGTRVVPVSIRGSHSVNPVLLRSRILPTILIIPRLLGVKYFPVTLGQLLWTTITIAFAQASLPWPGTAALAFLSFVFTPLVPIWPARIQIRLGEPISGSSPEAIYSLTQAAIQRGMDEDQ